MGAMFGPWGAAIGAVGGAAMGLFGSITGNRAAKDYEAAKQKAIDQQIQANRKRATDDYLAQVHAEQTQEDQQHMEVAQKNQDLSQAAMGAESTAVASAAERGVGGRSVAAIVADYNMQATTEAGRNELNQQWADIQHNQNLSADYRTYVQRASSIQPYMKTPVTPVDYFSPAFSLAGNVGKIAMSSGAGQA